LLHLLLCITQSAHGNKGKTKKEGSSCDGQKSRDGLPTAGQIEASNRRLGKGSTGSTFEIRGNASSVAESLVELIAALERTSRELFDVGLLSEDTGNVYIGGDTFP
jgi:hypothetical protein